jgi:hypothetical protein
MSSSRLAVLAGIAALIALASAFAVGRATKGDASDPTGGGAERIDVERGAAPSIPDLKPVAALPALKPEEKPARPESEPLAQPEQAPTPTPTPTPAPAPAPAPTQPSPSPTQPDTPQPFE